MITTTHTLSLDLSLIVLFPLLFRSDFFSFQDFSARSAVAVAAAPSRRSALHLLSLSDLRRVEPSTGRCAAAVEPRSDRCALRAAVFALRRRLRILLAEYCEYP